MPSASWRKQKCNLSPSIGKSGKGLDFRPCDAGRIGGLESKVVEGVLVWNRYGLEEGSHVFRT